MKNQGRCRENVFGRVILGVRAFFSGGAAAPDSLPRAGPAWWKMEVLDSIMDIMHLQLY